MKNYLDDDKNGVNYHSKQADGFKSLQPSNEENGIDD